MPGQGKTELLEFLDFVSSKGLMTKAATQSLKTACGAVLSILDEDEAQDIFVVDLEAVFRRYENLKGMEVSPNTLRAYRQRVKQAVSDFERYKANPSQWKPAVGQRSNRNTKRSGINTPDIESPVSQNSDVATSPATVDDIVHHFPLRRDAIVQITGIPFDVTKSEMARMTAFLSNLVAEVDDTQHPMLMSGSVEPDTA